MDIQLPRMSGLEASRRIRETKRPPAIIFTTAFAEHALDAYSVPAIGYLMKPIHPNQLANALEHAQDPARLKVAEPIMLDHLETNHICCQIQGSLKLISISKVYYFEACKKYTQIVHKNGVALTEISLKRFASNYPQRLLRVYRSVLINKAYLTGVQRRADKRYEVTLRNVPQTLPVSRRNLPAVRKYLKSFMDVSKTISEREKKFLRMRRKRIRNSKK